MRVDLPSNSGDRGVSFFTVDGELWELLLIESPYQYFRDVELPACTVRARGLRIDRRELHRFLEKADAVLTGKDTVAEVHFTSEYGSCELSVYATSDNLIVGPGQAGLTVLLQLRSFRSIEMRFVIDPTCIDGMREQLDELVGT